MNAIAEEIFDTFPEYKVDVLYSRLKEMGVHDWLKWKKEHNEVINKYIESTPMQRNKLKMFSALMPLLSFAAYQQCLAAYDVLRIIEKNNLIPGVSYRNIAASAANAYQEICELIEHEVWPWENDPFY